MARSASSTRSRLRVGREKRGQARVEAEAPPVIAFSPDLSHAADGAEAERLRDLPLDTPNPRTWRGCPPAVFGTIALKPFQRAWGRSRFASPLATCRWESAAHFFSFPETIPRSRSYVVRGTKMILLYSAVLLTVIAANVVTAALAATIAYRRMHHD